MIGVRCALTIIKILKLQDDELRQSLKTDLILAGWLGLIVGLVLMAYSTTNSGDFSITTFLNVLVAAQLPVLYGYLLGNVISVFFD